jgi:hypothetical protein
MTNIFNYKSHNLTPSQNLDLIRSIAMEKKFGRHPVKLRTGKILAKRMLVKRIENNMYVPTQKAKRMVQYV